MYKWLYAYVGMFLCMSRQVVNLEDIWIAGMEHKEVCDWVYREEENLVGIGYNKETVPEMYSL